ncbi:hypothetical protein SAMN05421837_106467 [Amycolatopsis pretoriensis]|uniref:Uncharacterized protein n=1 Tax=Amycolatopsis pretoriensis TaxID=218821 RepID=A0A1H5R3C5_9PSEU|nr:hypothetical protein [Amycolatopsis pretoriensis]SEF32855.1 hypothetical protein SAMN05421837_106467 [Amycolatopsis pretoriensis]
MATGPRERLEAIEEVVWPRGWPEVVAGATGLRGWLMVRGRLEVLAGASRLRGWLMVRGWPAVVAGATGPRG